MSELTIEDVLVAAFYVLVLGIWIGTKLEGLRWREKAESGFRMASGGTLYTVHEDAQMAHMRKIRESRLPSPFGDP